MARIDFFFSLSLSLFYIDLDLDLLSRETTCEECVLVVAELTVQMTTHDQAITHFLHDGFCQDEQLDNTECREVAGHYPDMLDVVITHHVDPLTVCMHEGPTPPCMKGGSSLGQFRDILARDMTCEECNKYIAGIKNHITGEEHIARYVHALSLRHVM